MRQAKRLLVSLNEALTTLKPNLQDEADIIDYDQHVYRYKDLSEKCNTLESNIIPPLGSTSPPPELKSDEKIQADTPLPLGINRNGSLSTIVFTTSSEFENKQERLLENFNAT